ncbi:MAG TPA: hypothetical protein VF324_06015 [Methanobacterium sp.]
MYDTYRGYKLKKKASIIGFLGLLVLIVFISGCTSSTNSSSNQSQNVTVQLNSNSAWNGTITYSGADHNVSGTGNSTYNLGTAPGAVTIYLKNDNNTGNLTVQLIQGTNVIQNQSTSETQEVISISHNF